jgi:hypothetical protein
MARQDQKDNTKPNKGYMQGTVHFPNLFHRLVTPQHLKHMDKEKRATKLQAIRSSYS